MLMVAPIQISRNPKIISTTKLFKKTILKLISYKICVYIVNCSGRKLRVTLLKNYLTAFSVGIMMVNLTLNNHYKRITASQETKKM